MHSLIFTLVCHRDAAHNGCVGYAVAIVSAALNIATNHWLKRAKTVPAHSNLTTRLERGH